MADLPKIQIKIEADPSAAKKSFSDVTKAVKQAEAATAAYEKELRALQVAQSSGLLSTKNASKELKAIEARYLAAQQAAAKLGGGMVVAGKGAKGMAGGLSALGNMSGQTRARIQNFGFQVQDITTQLTMGTRASLVMSQQLPQLAGAFGAVGAIVGAGIGLAIPALTIAFSALVGESKTLEDAIDDLSDALSESDNITKALSGDIAEIQAQYGAFNRAVLSLVDAQGDLQLRNMADAATALNDSLTKLYNGNAWLNVSRAEDLSNGLDLSAESARWFGSMMSSLSDAGSLNDQLGIVTAMREEFLVAAGNVGDMTAAQLEFFTYLTDSEAALTRLKSKTADVETATRGVTSAYQVYARTRMKAEADANAAIARGYQLYADTRVEANKLAVEIGQAAVDALALAGVDITSGISSAAKEAGVLAANLGVSLAEAQAIMNLSSTMTPSGISNEQSILMDLFNGVAGDLSRVQTPSAGVGAGGGAEDTRLSSLIDELKTEREILEEWRAENMELLNTANATELEALGGFNEAKLRLEEEYQERLQGIKKQAADSGLALTLGAADDVLSAMGAFNEKAFKIAKVAGAAQALISTYQGAAEALKLPFPQNLAAAAAVTAKGLGLVAAIKSATSSGSSGGGGVASAIGSGAQPTSTPLQATISGLNPDSLFSGSSIRELFDRLSDEAGDRGISPGFT